MSKRLLIAWVWLLAACGGGSGSGATCPTDNALTYDTFGQSFFRSYCDRCHQGGQLPELTSQSSIRAARTLIDGDVAAGPLATNTVMPPSGPRPSLAERQQLGQWLACLAP